MLVWTGWWPRDTTVIAKGSEANIDQYNEQVRESRGQIVGWAINKLKWHQCLTEVSHCGHLGELRGGLESGQEGIKYVGSANCGWVLVVVAITHRSHTVNDTILIVNFVYDLPYWICDWVNEDSSKSKLNQGTETPKRKLIIIPFHI